MDGKLRYWSRYINLPKETLPQTFLVNFSNKIGSTFSFTLDIRTICVCNIILKWEAVLIQGWTSLFHPARIFASKITHLVGHVKNRWEKLKYSCDRETTEALRFVLYYLNRTFECFCKDAFLDWMLFECLKWDVYQRITFILQTNPPKHEHKNIMKA